jgi:hypothetical protein
MPRWFGAAAVIAAMVTCGPAVADAIDGNWCHSDGRHFSIRGADIVTPGGKEMQGNYARHSFSYVSPAPERGAGAAIMMLLVNENTVHLRYGDEASAPEVWLRCSPSVSSLPQLPAG